MWGYASRISSTGDCFQRESRALWLPPCGVSLHVTRRFLDCWSSSVRIVSGYAQRSIVHLSETGKFIHYGIAITLLFLTPLVATTQKVAKMIRQHNVFAITTIQRRESARERSRKWRKSKGIANHEIKLSKSLLISSRLRLHDLLGTVLDDRHSPSLFVLSSKRWALFYVSPLFVECSQPFHLCWDESCIPL